MLCVDHKLRDRLVLIPFLPFFFDHARDDGRRAGRSDGSTGDAGGGRITVLSQPPTCGKGKSRSLSWKGKSSPLWVDGFPLQFIVATIGLVLGIGLVEAPSVCHIVPHVESSGWKARASGRGVEGGGGRGGTGKRSAGNIYPFFFSVIAETRKITDVIKIWRLKTEVALP